MSEPQDRSLFTVEQHALTAADEIDAYAAACWDVLCAESANLPRENVVRLIEQAHTLALVVRMLAAGR